MSELQLCVDCKNMVLEFGTPHCDKTRTHHTNPVTGRKWSSTTYCADKRNYLPTCSDFEQKPEPTLIQRLKEVFS